MIFSTFLLILISFYKKVGLVCERVAGSMEFFIYIRKDLASWLLSVIKLNV